MNKVFLIAAALILVGSTGAQADSIYTPLELERCEVLATFEGGGADLRCVGLGELPVFVSEGDARTDVDFGAKSDAFETFFAFNGVGDTVEWMRDEDGVPYAAAIRYLIDTDGRSAEALVVSKVGSDRTPGCVVGVVDASAEQANGIARGLGAMAPLFDCARDRVVIVPGAGELVSGFGGANQ